MSTRTSTEKSRELVLSKCKAFSDFRVWPPSPPLNPEKWLSNFDDAERRPLSRNYISGRLDALLGREAAVAPATLNVRSRDPAINGQASNLGRYRPEGR